MARNGVKIPRDLERAAEAARAAGWTLTPTRGRHLAWRHPGGTVVHTASTPSEYRGTKNALACLRRAGLELAR